MIYRLVADVMIIKKIFYSALFNTEENCDVMVPRSQKFLDHNNRELKRRQRRRQRERQKSNKFMLAKQQLCTSITPFCTFLSRRSTTMTWNFLILGVRFINYVNTTQFFFLFLNLNTVLSNSSSENLANIWQINWKWTRSMESETVF